MLALTWLAALLALAAPQDPAAESPSPPRPNVLLILCDDLGFSDLGCYGGEIDTPNLDRLAAQGLRFTQFYNNAKCTTTRASIVTGLYPRKPLLDAAMPTIAEVLREADYATSLSGKWHLGRGRATHPFRRGFERFYGLLDGCCNFFDPSRPDPKFKGGRVRAFGHDDRRITEFPPDYYTTEAFTDHALESIRAFASGDGADRRPFFAHVCYTAPHYPLHARPADIARFRGRYREGWNALREARYARQLASGLFDAETAPLSALDDRAYAWADAQQDWEDLRMATYAAMVFAMDREIGRLLDALDELDLTDDTLVLFLSDNGGCAEEPGGRDTSRTPGPVDDYTAVGPAWGWAQNAPFRRYKQWCHEGGVATPLIVRWPGVVPADAITHEVGHIVDFVPTFLALAGGSFPTTWNERATTPLDGIDLTPVLRGRERIEPVELYWRWGGNRAARHGNWKAVYERRTKRWELFDLATDRTETVDHATDEPERLAELVAAWDAWAERTGAKR